MTFRAGPRLAPALAAVALVAAGAVALPALAWLAAGAAAALLLWAALEGALLARVRVDAARAGQAVVSLGHTQQLPVTLSHDATVPLKMEVRTRWPRELGGGSSTARGLCRAGERLALSHPVTGAARGEAQIDSPHLAFTRWGLLERVAQAGPPQLLRVLPDMEAVKRLHAQFNALFLRGQGTRMAPRNGQGREFDRLREYVRGDDFRQLAWKASARQGKLIVREFRVERSQDVLVCVDRGHRMAARIGSLTRTDHAVNAALLAAYVCNRGEDRSGLLSFSAGVDRGVPQGRGAPHLAAITRFATGISPQYLQSDYRALAAHVRRRLRARTLVLVLTVLPERGDHFELVAALKMMMPRHLPLLLVLRDAGLEAAMQALPADRGELDRALVATELVQGKALLVRELRQLGALVVETTPEELGTAAVNAYLDVKRRQLL